MAKFCGNCGNQLNDNDRVCGNCGMPCQNLPVVQQYAGVPAVKKQMNPKTKKRIKLIAILSGVLIVLIIVAVIAFNIISENTGYKGTLNKAMDAFEKYDIDTLISMTSDISFGSMDATDIEKYISRTVSAKLDQYEKEAGHDMDLSYEITDSYKLSERKFKEFLDYAEDYYHYDTSDISEIMVVNLKVTAKGSKGEDTFNSNDLYLVKERDSWYLFYGNVGTSY